MGEKYDYLDKVIEESFEKVEVGFDFNRKLLDRIDNKKNSERLYLSNSRISGLSLVLSGIFIVILKVTSMEGYFLDVFIKAKMFSNMFINYFN